ncbi:autotransporter domain-containing protein [Iodidimonas sp. SYSU 1G8]|uniref:autotransporter outer membrane beta-barrel domain-containing protein n=1 Tax=Iodidimonas sp. SYSU 1G8 TaxID=3133967 RepID=UPI0031FF1F09
MYQVQTRRRLRAGSVIARSLLIAGTVATPGYALAADLTLDNSRNETVRTSNASSGAGNITINSGGSVSVDEGDAVIVDSSHKVTNGGRIESKSGSDGVGILIDGAGTITSVITNNGTISLVADTDTDTVDQKNYGILLEGDTNLAGDIINGAAGTITVDGQDSVGIYTKGSVTGNIKNQGTINASGLSGNGMLIDGPVTGSVSNSGTINTGKASFTTGFGDQAKTTPETRGGEGIAVSGSVTAGVINDGDALTQQEEADLTSGKAEEIRGKKKDDVGTDGTIAVLGGANALWVGAGGGTAGDITIGAVGTEGNAYGVINRGDLASSSTTEGQAVETVRIGGLTGSAGSTTVVGGFFNDGGEITSKAVGTGTSTAVAIGAFANVPEIRNTGLIEATAAGGIANGIVIEQSAEVGKIENSGTIVATSATAAANGIVDRSGSVTSFNNTGTVEATGSTATAIDFSASSQDITFTNTGDITGAVKLGGGGDTVTITGGTLTGDLELGAGSNTLTLADEAVFTGDLTATQGQVDLVVTNATFAIASSKGAQVNNASFDKDSTLSIPIFGSDSTAGTLKASGTVSFADGATLVTDFKTLSSEDITFTLVDSTALAFESDLNGLNINDTSAFFDTIVSLDEADPTNIIVTVKRATAEDLGLNPNQTAIFNASGSVLEADTELGGAMARLQTDEQVQDAFNQLMPDNSGATQQGIFKSQAAIFGAINKRMDGIYKLDQRYKERVDRLAGKDPKRAEKLRKRNDFTIWAEQLVYVAKQSPYGNQLGFGGYSYGIAAGVDYPLFGLDAVGVSISQVWSEYREKTSFDKPTSVQTTQFNIYAGYETNGFFIDATGGYGISSYDQERRLVIGTVDRRMFSDWSGHHFAANVRAGYGAKIGRFSLSAAASLSYMKLHESGYVERSIQATNEEATKTEATTPDGVKLVVSSQDVEFLRGNIGVQLGMRIEDGTGIIEPQLRAGMTREFSYKGPVNVAHFLQGGPATAFTTLGELGSASTFYAGTGVDLSAYFGTLSFDYDVEFGGGKLNHVGSATVRVSF